MASAKLLLLLVFAISVCLQYHSVTCFEYEVGGNRGWAVPPPNDTKFYNEWASENRFRIGDTVRFKYRKDSVMEVNEADYKKCNSSHPEFFSNNGNTAYRLDHSGAFYFISGVSGHCGKGQRLIIKVITPEDESSTQGGGKSPASSHAAVLRVGIPDLVVAAQFVLLCVASRLI